jgi:acetyl-CoA acetyltransferase
MGMTGELVAEKYEVTREEQDAYAAYRATPRGRGRGEAGKFDKRDLPGRGAGPQGRT